MHQSQMRALVFVMMVMAILVACSGENGRLSRTSQLDIPTLEPTPTLLPGLPTSTPTSAVKIVDEGNIPAPPTPRVAPSPTSKPTATPDASGWLAIGTESLVSEDFVLSSSAFQASLMTNELDDSQRQEALLGLGRAQLAAGAPVATTDTLNQLLAMVANANEPITPEVLSNTPVDEAIADIAYFLLAQAYEQQNDCTSAISAYERYLTLNPDLAAYIQSRIGACHLNLGNRDAAVQAYSAAAAADTYVTKQIELKHQLAGLYLEDGDYPSAIETYESLLLIAKDEKALGDITYQLGSAEILAGLIDEGYAHYQEAVEKYPKSDGSYRSLIALVDAGYAVEDYQRGVVDYYAKAYDPAIAVLSRYVVANPEHREDAHLYLAWSFEGVGNVASALGELDTYIEAFTGSEAQGGGPADMLTGTPVDNTVIITGTAAISTPAQSTPGTVTVTPGLPDTTPQSDDSTTRLTAIERQALARGWFEKGKLQARAGMTIEAIDSYRTYTEEFTDGENGPYAAWWAAALTEQLGDTQEAIDYYQRLADLYPEHEDSDEALFRAGYLLWQNGDQDGAVESWKRAAEAYPHYDYGAAALVWLLIALQADEAEPYLKMASATVGEGHYQIRAREIASDTTPFMEAARYDIERGEAGRDLAEAWLAEKLGLESVADVAGMLPELMTDGRLTRGAKLWSLGLRQEAKQELESLRSEFSGNPLASYQLSLFYRDLGLYRSSILAAVSVMRSLEANVYQVPTFIGRLAYPTYYADLVVEEARKYGYDPLLQFALLRQESLFESFATSHAAAQGLSQVIPDTGRYIAQQLNWPAYKNEDLYRPYVGIAFGAYYLAQQLDFFDGDIAAALSAYNAGPGNAARWHEIAPNDIDLFVQTIDFFETQQYVMRIHAGQAIYRYLYGS